MVEINPEPAAAVNDVHVRLGMPADEALVALDLLINDEAMP